MATVCRRYSLIISELKRNLYSCAAFGYQFVVPKNTLQINNLIFSGSAEINIHPNKNRRIFPGKCRKQNKYSEGLTGLLVTKHKFNSASKKSPRI